MRGTETTEWIEVHLGAGFKPALLRQTPLRDIRAQLLICVRCARAGWKSAPTSLLICALPRDKRTPVDFLRLMSERIGAHCAKPALAEPQRWLKLKGDLSIALRFVTDR